MNQKDLQFVVAEDNPMMLKMMVSMLQDLGYQHIRAANNGEEAWALLQAEEAHIVLSDHLMPKMTGMELLKRVRSSSKYWDLPFIIITSEDHQNTLVATMEIEVDAYIIKPFTITKLKSEIDSVYASKYNPSPYQQALNLGKTLFLRENNPETALVAFQQARDLKIGEADPHYFIGLVLEKLGQSQEAKVSLRKCIQLKESYALAYDLLAEIFHRERDYAQEIATLKTINELADDNVRRNLRLGSAYAQVKDTTATHQCLKRAAKLADGNRPILEKIIRAYLEAGMAENAETIYRKYIDSAMIKPRLLNKYALIFKNAKFFDSARYFLEKIVELWTRQKEKAIPVEEMAVYYFNLAVVYIEEKNHCHSENCAQNYKKAENYVNKAIDCDATNSEAIRLLNWLEDKVES